MKRVGPISILVTLLSIPVGFSAALAAPAADAPSAEATEAGVWQKHEYRFQYMGFTSTYSCDGLADKLKVLLKYAGARKDMKVYGNCVNGPGRPDKFANASMTFYTLAPATGDAGVATQPAVWRTIDISAREPREVGAGDCELIEQFRTNILPFFSTRNIDNGTTCIPHQLSGSTIALKFDALTPPAAAAKSR